MSSSIYEQAQAAISELCEKAKLKAGNIVVAGCSTSEVIGSKIGTNSSPEVAAEIFAALHDYTQSKGLYLAVQCCVVPQPKAGGSLATKAYAGFADPVAVEDIKADAGLDIGLTLIGMHLKKVAVPVRLENNRIGEAIVVAARTRPKFIGGVRATYDQNLL